MAPSVSEPAPSVTIRSAPFSLMSFTISRTSVHGVCGLMPYLMPAILFLISDCNSEKFSVLLMETDNYQIDFGSLEGVGDVMSAGFVEWETIRYVGLRIWRECQTVALAFCRHLIRLYKEYATNLR